MQQDIQALMDRWSRWRIDRIVIGRMPCMTGKLMAGMKSTVCPACHGEGRMPGHKIGSSLAWIDPCPQCNGHGRVSGGLDMDVTRYTRKCPDCKKGEIDGKTCVRCRGTGKLRRIDAKVNPASIAPTVRKFYSEDPVSEKIDRIVAGWRKYPVTRPLHKVVLFEHCRPGRQADKAMRVGVSQQYYSYLLDRAHWIIQVEVNQAA